MKVPLNWLREYCSPALDTAAIEERLTMTGTKVETILHHGVSSPEHFVVGRVLSVEPHPKADRLKMCEVEIGEQTPAGIVCGAPNVAAGQTVAVALPGAVMPDGTRIKAAKLRGIPSNGMILAADELEIDDDHAGIMVLDEMVVDAELPPGAPLDDVLGICTDVLELEITPNRPDCLGVYGVARELHAATGAPLTPEPWAEDSGGEEGLGACKEGVLCARVGRTDVGTEQTDVEVSVECPDLCKRFTARAFEDVKIAPSPPWLKARLSAAGQRPINNVVDITNYAMLLTGQPLHAFDLDRVAGGRLTVRRALEEEQVRTLDGQVRTLDGEMVVIEDAKGPTSIAGIMGGERSEVRAETSRVLMEVACWDGPNIHKTSWALGLRSEASGRFEKGLAPEQCMHAQAVATRLMIEVCGAKLVPGTIDLAWKPAPAQKIPLRERKVEAILGMPVSRTRQAEILRALDFGVTEVGGALSEEGASSASARVLHEDDGPLGERGLDVTVPAVRRNDVTREADLIEEVARIHGLGELPATLPARRGAYGRLSPAQRLRRRAVDVLVGRGLYETVGWTFTSPTLHDRLRLPEQDPRRRAPVLENPLSEDQSLLRTTLLGSLLDVAAHNSARGTVDLRLFEMGSSFVQDGEPAANAKGMGIREHSALGVLLSGRLKPPTWGASDPPRADLFAVKGVLEALGEALRVELECRPGSQPFLHPLVAREWGIEGAAAMELELDPLLAMAGGEHAYRDVISYPVLRQDLAVVLPEDVPAGQVLETVRQAASQLLDEVSVFDVYSGPQVGAGKRSLALSLAFRAPDRTLTDEDVAPVRTRIVAALGELGGELRA
jgi:phenylalanyl-tRNA synthetase beta chain